MMMRNVLHVLLPAALLAMLCVGCQPEPLTYEADDLVGKWGAGTEYYRYDANGEGATWDVADDVTEAEAQPFSWTLDEDQLTLVHHMEMGGDIPKSYTVTMLTASTLIYKDVYNQTYTFTRVSSK